VSDSRSFSILQGIVRRESRTLLQYIRDSFPWTPASDESALIQLRQLADEQREETAKLGRWLSRNRQIVPNLGSFPAAFTTINYASLDYVIPKVIADERADLLHMEQDLASITDADARTIAAELVEKKRQHLKAIEELVVAAATIPP
jgi:hypothetical protein